MYTKPARPSMAKRKSEYRKPEDIPPDSFSKLYSCKSANYNLPLQSAMLSLASSVVCLSLFVTLLLTRQDEERTKGSEGREEDMARFVSPEA